MNVFRIARLYHRNVQIFALDMQRPAQVPLDLCLTS